MAEPLRSLRTDDYHVAWISAIRREFDIALAILDETFDTPPDLPEEDDENVYIFGRVRGHNVVMASLPEGRVGTEEAGRLATQITRSFKRLRFGLMVGIAGGAPSKNNDIRLGDIVVSVPNDSKRLGGVVNYFYGASIQETGFQRRGSLNAPPTVLLSAVRLLASKHGPVGIDVDQCVSQLISKHSPALDAYARPSSNSDVLFNAAFLHAQSGEECANVCYQAALEIVARDERLQKPTVTIHYGIVGSASNLMRDAILRDRIAQEDGALCFEMESAGLMNNRLGWLVVRGISDYSDTHKSDQWQNYAAVVAAVYSRELLGVIRPRKEPTGGQEANPEPSTRKQDLLQALKYDNMDVKRRFVMPEGSFDHSWIWRTSFDRWLTDSDEPFWICGKAGSGKSTLVAYLASHKDTRRKLQIAGNEFQVIHYFYDYRDGTRFANNVVGMLRSFLYQLADRFAVVKTQLQHQLDTKDLNLESEQSLLECTCEVVKSPGFRVCAFIDGLDEYFGEYSHLMETFKILEDRTEIKFCFACRPDIEISMYLKLFSQIIMQDHNEASMGGYADNVFQHNRLSPIINTLEVSKTFKGALIQKAEGIILWFKLTFDDMVEMCRTDHSLEQIRIFIDDLPRGLEPLFEQILERIKPGHRYEAALLLRLFQELDDLCAAPLPIFYTRPNTKSLEILWGMYDIAVAQLGRSSSLPILATHVELMTHLKSMLRGLLEVYRVDPIPVLATEDATENDNKLSIRYIHKSFYSFITRSSWVVENLGPSFKQLWPDAFFLRLAAFNLCEVSNDNIPGSSYLQSCVQEFSALQDNNLLHAFVERNHDPLQVQEMFKVAQLSQHSYLLPIAVEMFPSLRSMESPAVWLQISSLRSRLFRILWTRSTSKCPQYLFPTKWRRWLPVLRLFYYFFLWQAAQYEKYVGSSYSIITPMLQSDQGLVLSMFLAFSPAFYARHVGYALKDRGMHHILDLILAVHANLYSYVTNRLQTSSLSVPQWKALSQAALHRLGDYYEPEDFIRFLNITVPHGGKLGHEEVCIFFRSLIFKDLNGSIWYYVQAILPFVQDGRPRPDQATGLLAYDIRGIEGNALLLWLEALQCLRDENLRRNELFSFGKCLLAVCLRLGLDINAPCYKRGTVLRAVFDGNALQGAKYLEYDALAVAFLILIDAGADPSRSGDIGALVKDARTFKFSRSCEEGGRIMVDYLRHFKKHGQWPQDGRLLEYVRRSR